MPNTSWNCFLDRCCLDWCSSTSNLAYGEYKFVIIWILYKLIFSVFRCWFSLSWNWFNKTCFLMWTGHNFALCKPTELSDLLGRIYSIWIKAAVCVNEWFFIRFSLIFLPDWTALQIIDKGHSIMIDSHSKWEVCRQT